MKNVILIAARDYLCLKNKENWERYAGEHGLPEYETIKSKFKSWKQFKKEVYLFIAKNHKDYFYTPKYWDHHAKENQLPEAKNYRALFGNWKAAQVLVHEDLTLDEIKRKFLVSIAKKYPQHLQSQKEWDEFAEKNDLPISATFKNHFSKWNMVIELVTGEKVKEKRYTKEGILQVLSEHKPYLITQETWKQYAQQYDLPSVNTIVKHFGSFNAVKQKLSLNKIQKREFIKEELWNIAQEHKEMFHLSIWNFYATTYQLPTETAFINHFGSFKAVQDKLGMSEGECFEKSLKRMEITVETKKKVLLDLIQANQKMIETITGHWNLLESKRQWDPFAEEQSLPSYNLLLSLFGSKKQIKQAIFLFIALQNKEFFNNTEWDNYAKLNQLPMKTQYYNLFSSWKWIQQMVWGDKKESKKAYLLRKAKENIEHFTTYKEWNEHASTFSLPSASQYEFYFGSWNEVKKELGLKLNRVNVS
ncbi:hypothetical protein [Virgibacillus halodenitrificans]|uniref:hypothetical protein n=1 Tax=Virgibacillus halodenitrificans TaxID=1482 RepID=UPI000EF4ACBC|nr:hypothetical protein [Virgibacillus halodenitrificans]